MPDLGRPDHGSFRFASADGAAALGGGEAVQGGRSRGEQCSRAAAAAPLLASGSGVGVVRQRHRSGVEDMAAAVRAAQPRGVAADGAGEGARLELPPHTAALPLVHCLV